jgi:protein O-mannosyl-transferase
VRRQAGGFVGAWFFLILAPTSSVMPLNGWPVEHHLYLPLAAVVTIVVWAAWAFFDRLLLRRAISGTGLAAMRRAIPLAALLAVLVALGHATVARNEDYRTALALWQGEVAQHADNIVAQCSLGLALAALGRTEDAIEHYHETLRINPNYPDARAHLGRALAVLGRTDEAIASFQEALQLDADLAEARTNLGNVLAGLGKSEEAIAQYRLVLRRNPTDAVAENNLANVLGGLGKNEEAIEHYRRAVQLQPDYAEAYNNLGTTLIKVGKAGEAIEPYREALRLQPDYAEAHKNLALALAAVGRCEEAVAEHRQALKLRPDDGTSHFNLGNVLAQTGRVREAVAQYDRALQAMPDCLAVVYNLARLLATREPADGGDPVRAVSLAQRARELSGPDDFNCLDILAAAYASAGRFADAVGAEEKAVQLTAAAGQAEVAEQMRSRLELYRAGRPYREGK